MNESGCSATLTALLEGSGVRWERCGGWTRFRFRNGQMTWELACRCDKDIVLVYSRWPMRVKDENAALELCSTANSRLLHGAMYIAGGIPSFRICVDMSDPYGSEERMARGLEYSAEVIVRYWGGLQAVCDIPENTGRDTMSGE